jgi:hypothetical protein
MYQQSAWKVFFNNLDRKISEKFSLLSMSSNTTNTTNATAGGNTNSTEASKTVNAPPYKLASCDQVVEIEGNILTDMNDFSQKSPAFFTMSVYMVNQFDKKDGNTLRQSLSIDKIIVTPDIIQGSVSCINFQDSSFKRIPMCLTDKATAQMVLNSFNQIMKCRLGDNLKNTPASIVNNIMKASCLGLDVSFDVNKFGGDLNKAKASLSTAINNALKNATKNLKGSVTPEQNTPDAKAKIDGKSGTQPAQ